MQWSLFLLFLAGQCSFFTCCLFEYHFITIKKTWDEAQAYCRKNYTDLATVYDMADMKRLSDLVNGEAAWIGLYRNLGSGNTKWHWSLPGVEFSPNKTAWKKEEPNDHGGQENCVLIVNNEGQWNDKKCDEPNKFICYDETQQSQKKFHLIRDKMKWPEAQSYCREHHTDLVSGFDQLQSADLMNKIQSGQKLWIGLFRDTWSWSDGSNSSFRNSDLDVLKDGRVKKHAMTVSEQKWSSTNCQTKKPFVCYDDKVILVKENKTWEEALNYCRQHYHDLVSITNPHQQRWVQERANKADTPYVWLGLRYSCTLDLWFWISDHLVCYDNWAPHENTEECDKAAAMDRGGQHKWFGKNDTMKFNFVCALKPPNPQT